MIFPSWFKNKELRRGLLFGKRRRGHPEGIVRKHVLDILRRIDRDNPNRKDLVFLAVVHDSFKYLSRKGAAITDAQNHASLAATFAKQNGFMWLIDILQFHDEPYALYLKCGKGKREIDKERLGILRVRIGYQWDLFMEFIKLDGTTDGKDGNAIEWFEKRPIWEATNGRSGI